MTGSVVKPEHRPTLAELLGPRLGARGLRLLAVAAATGLVALGAFALLNGDPDRQVIASAGGVEFNFIHDPKLAAVAARPGEVLRLETGSRGRFVQSFSVAPLELPPYKGEAGAVLPLLADREIAALAAARDQFELVQEGKARINDVAGYTISYRARLGQRRLYGRLLLLPAPQPGTRRGLKVMLEATPAAGVPRAADVGARGLTKRPYRSLRFGRDRP